MPSKYQQKKQQKQEILNDFANIKKQIALRPGLKHLPTDYIPFISEFLFNLQKAKNLDSFLALGPLLTYFVYAITGIQGFINEGFVFDLTLYIVAIALTADGKSVMLQEISNPATKTIEYLISRLRGIPIQFLKPFSYNDSLIIAAKKATSNNETLYISFEESDGFFEKIQQESKYREFIQKGKDASL